jgi:hypothetical protein
MQLIDCPFCHKHVPPTQDGICPLCRSSVIDGSYHPLNSTESDNRSRKTLDKGVAEVKQVAIASFSNAVEANAALAHVENEGIMACLSDEHTIDAYGLYDVAVGGVKIMVAEEDAARATSVLNKKDIAISDKDDEIICPHCKSNDVKTVDNRWKSFLTILLLGFPIFSTRKRYECQSCEYDWKQ